MENVWNTLTPAQIYKGVTEAKDGILMVKPNPAQVVTIAYLAHMGLIDLTIYTGYVYGLKLEPLPEREAFQTRMHDVESLLELLYRNPVITLSRGNGRFSPAYSAACWLFNELKGAITLDDLTADDVRVALNQNHRVLYRALFDGLFVYPLPDATPEQIADKGYGLTPAMLAPYKKVFGNAEDENADRLERMGLITHIRQNLLNPAQNVYRLTVKGAAVLSLIEPKAAEVYMNEGSQLNPNELTPDSYQAALEDARERSGYTTFTARSTIQRTPGGLSMTPVQITQGETVEYRQLYHLMREGYLGRAAKGEVTISTDLTDSNYRLLVVTNAPPDGSGSWFKMYMVEINEGRLLVEYGLKSSTFQVKSGYPAIVQQEIKNTYEKYIKDVRTLIRHDKDVTNVWGDDGSNYFDNYEPLPPANPIPVTGSDLVLAVRRLFTNPMGKVNETALYYFIKDVLGEQTPEPTRDPAPLVKALEIIEAGAVGDWNPASIASATLQAWNEQGESNG